MPHDIPLKGGDERDALTSARGRYFWKPGQLRKIKRGYNKRSRRLSRGGECFPRFDEDRMGLG